MGAGDRLRASAGPVRARKVQKDTPFAPDDNMRTALDALAAEHNIRVRLRRAASRSGLSMWLVSRRVDALSHSFKLANVHNNMHLFLHTLISNLAAT